MVARSGTATSQVAGPHGDDDDFRSDRPDRYSRLTPLNLFLVLLVCWVLVKIQLILIIGLLALLFGTILEGPVQRIEARRVPRPAAITMVYAVFIGSIALLIAAVAGPIADQADEFREQAPEQFRSLQQDWRQSSNPILSGVGADLLGRGIDFLEEPGDTVNGGDASRALPVLQGIGTVVFSILTLLVITFYYLLEKSLIRRVVLDYIHPDRRGRVNRIWEDAERKVGSWMRGQLLLCLIIGTIATTSYGIVGLRFWPLLGLWAGITEIIPIIGPWLGGIPAVLIALTMGWETALITAAIILGMQTLENWILVPRVMRGAVGLTPMTVFVAILAGTQLLGVPGAILAIPIAAVVQVILTDFLDRRRGRHSQSAISGWRWMLTRGPLRDDDEGPASPDAGEFTSFEDQIESDAHELTPDHEPVPTSNTEPQPPVRQDRPRVSARRTTAGEPDSRWRFLGVGKQDGESHATPEAPRSKPDKP
jgi:predicted PurR-regulated permease PerM